MPLYSDEGMVLRTIDLGEADRIVTILTPRHGKVRAVARGVRRTKSRLGGRLEPFVRSNLLIATGRSLDVVSQATVITAYARSICSDYNAYLAASVIAETIDKITPEQPHASTWHEIAPQNAGSAQDVAQYRLMLGAISTLSRRLHTPCTVAYSYVMRALALAGWLPRLDSCVVCGEGECRHFSSSAGGVMCDTHQLPDSRTVDAHALTQLGALIDGAWDVLDAEPRLDATTIAIVEEWSEYYLDHPIRSLRLLHSIA